MNVDIYIRERNGSREIRIPLLPETIIVSRGEAEMISYSIMNKGNVVIPSGVGLAGFSWESEFPGANRTDRSMQRGAWKSPSTYDKILESWKKNGTPLTLMVTGYPINSDVYVKDYKATISGGFGDIAYSLEFIEARDITIKSTKVNKKPASTPAKRTAAKTSTYTIKSGDTLWGIAKRFYGSGAKWEKIYNANKTIIEKTAKKHGKSSSNRGNWIYPGVKLTIPK
ncbi:MAG: LysM peptidoglycan-binding domain-containing protein [Clostridia bacterium]|nr:LysM peptidoglycan-binding domain-containing protein [Clostridia bacterium]